MDGPIAIEADRVEWSAGVATAEGGVEVRFGEEVLVGTRATWDGALVVVEAGEYRRPEGVFAFDRAEVRPREGTGVIVGARAESGGAIVEAARLEVGAAGSARWEATDATLVPCQCADGKPPAVTFRAARITVIPEEVVIVRGGVARVFAMPVLPVPYWRVPLDPHRFRLLVPEVGWGEYGPAAKIEGRGGARIGDGDWYLQGGPAWRADTGLRGELALTGPNVVAQGALGWDAEVGAVRGVGASRGGVDQAVRAAWDVAYVSDAEYLADYAVDYVARGVAWRESRGVVALLDGGAALDVWAPDDRSAGSLARVRFDRELGSGRALSVTPRVGADLVGVVGEPALGIAEAGVGMRAAGGTSWLRAEARGDVAGRLAWLNAESALAAAGAGATTGIAPREGAWGTLGTGAGAWGEGLADGPLARWGSGGEGVAAVAAGELAAPLWSTLGPARIQWWPGIRGEARVGWSPGDAGAAWRVGPSVRVSSSVGAGVFGFDAALLQDGAGWRPAGALDVLLARVAARVQADAGVQVGEVRWMPGPVTLAVGSTHADAGTVSAAGTGSVAGGGGVAGGPGPPAPSTLWLAWGDAAVAVGRFRTGAGLAWDLAAEGLDGGFSGADARVGYDDGCAAATITARFSPDRALPDFGFAATFRR